MDHRNHRNRNFNEGSQSYSEFHEKTKKILFILRFLKYARKKVLDDKINQEMQAASESKIDTINRKLLESNFLVSVFGLIVSLINLYLSYQIPFRLAFYNDHRVPELYVHDLVLDGILFVSLLIRIYIRKAKISGVKPVKRSLIIVMYLFHIRFYTDFISLIPLYMIDSRWYWLKIARIVRVNTIISWIKNTEPPTNKLKNFIMNHYNVYNTILTVLWFSNMIMITCHCIACLWFYIPNELSTPNALTWLGESWATYTTSDNYMRSLYWTAVTFSSVGYGDITGKTTEEYIFSMFVEFLGIMCFGYLMGSLTSLLNSYQAKKEKIRYRENELTKWLIFVEDQIQNKEVQDKISESITNYFKNKWVCDPTSLSGFDDHFRTLPPNLAQELSEHLFRPRINIFSSFFKNFTDIQLEIASKLNIEKYICAQDIIEADKENKNIYLITSGKIFVGQKDKGYNVELGHGAYFGEDSAIFDDKSLVSFHIEREVLLYFFNFKDLKSIFKRSRLNLLEFAKISFIRAKYFEAITKCISLNEGTISETEFEIIGNRFNISEEGMTLDKIVEFKERSKNLEDIFNKGEQDELDPEANLMIESLQKESDDFGKELQIVKEKYEKKLKRVISKIDQAIDSKRS